MPGTKPLTADLCKQIEARLEEAIKPIAGEFGLDFAMLKPHLDPDGSALATHCQFTVPARQNTTASQKEEDDFRCYAESFGMRASWLGRSFKRGHISYKVVGLRVNAPKECVILERTDGSRGYENGALVSRHLT